MLGCAVSEIASLFQSNFNILSDLFEFGIDLKYASLIVFTPFLVFCLLASITCLLRPVILFLGTIIFCKIFMMPHGDEFIKAVIFQCNALLLLAVLSKCDLADLCYWLHKFRVVILMLGVSYVLLWYNFGQYRNASTFSAFVMLIIGYSPTLKRLSWIFLSVAKSQFIAFGLLFLPLIKVRLGRLWRLKFGICKKSKKEDLTSKLKKHA